MTLLRTAVTTTSATSLGWEIMATCEAPSISVRSLRDREHNSAYDGVSPRLDGLSTVLALNEGADDTFETST